MLHKLVQSRVSCMLVAYCRHHHGADYSHVNRCVLDVGVFYRSLTQCIQTVDVGDPPHLLPRSLRLTLTPLAMLLGRSAFSRSTQARRRDPPLRVLLLGDALSVDRFSPIEGPPSPDNLNGGVLLLVARPRRGKTGLISSDKRSPSLSSSKVDPASGL